MLTSGALQLAAEMVPVVVVVGVVVLVSDEPDPQPPNAMSRVNIQALKKMFMLVSVLNVLRL